MKISVIVPTYNRPKSLQLCLLSLAQQSMLPSEVLIADDGSTPDTRDMAENLRQSLHRVFPIKHVWQEDDGFRKPRIINETVRRASGDYLVFIDGDCMAHRHFIRSHAAASDQNAILSGKRVDIGQALTERLLRDDRMLTSIGFRLVYDALFGGANKSRKVEESVRITNKVLRLLLHRDRITDDGVWGCNFSLYKNLFVDINGCDEDFLDGSVEDNDIGIRVLNQGKRIRSMRNLSIVFHLWHPSSWSFESRNHQFNLQIIRRRVENRETRCVNGINRPL